MFFNFVCLFFSFWLAEKVRLLISTVFVIGSIAQRSTSRIAQRKVDSSIPTNDVHLHLTTYKLTYDINGLNPGLNPQPPDYETHSRPLSHVSC